MSGGAAPSNRAVSVAGWLAGLASMALFFIAGSSISKFEPVPTDQRTVEVTITGDDGRPIGGATIAFGKERVRTDGAGRADLDLTWPTVAVASQNGYLDEPFAVDPLDGAVSLQMWAREDDAGRQRTSVHFGGDVMLGRRFLDAASVNPFVEDETSARRVVSELSAMAAAADTTVVNLESVIGDAPVEEALIGKRFVIQSSPLVTETLDELGVDLVTLGNNHVYDWGERGLESTFEALDAAGVAHVGAGFDDGSATRGRIIASAGLRLGIVSATTVTGDYVNDSLPLPEEVAPADLPSDDAWQYEPRVFGLRPATSEDRSLVDTRIPLEEIRASEAWKIVKAAEEHFSPEDADNVWRLVYSAFPELQDWVARRGHGGAARYQPERVAEEVEQLRQDGADVVVVQINGGYKFATVESEFMRRAAHAAIDAGADAVISHHPHVLQGVEWYRGSLIAHSLGNLVFAQDFHATFPSTLLRVVTDGEQILDARLLPLVLDRYRPTPLTGDAARDVVGLIAARSELSATSMRFGHDVRSVIDEPASDESTTASVVFDRNSGRIDRVASDHEQMSVQLDDQGRGTLPPCSTVRADLLPDGVQIADELLWWGSFDRITTAADRTFPVGWLVPSDHERWETVEGTVADHGNAAMNLTTAPNESTILRISALVDLPAHRLFDSAGEPVDAPADIELRLRIRRDRGELPVLRLTSYERHDRDPTVDPNTERLNQLMLPLEVPLGGGWTELSVPIPPELLASDEGAPTALSFAFILPPAHLGAVAVDDVELLEWRGRVNADRDVWLPAAALRTRNGAGLAPDAVDVTIRTC